MKTYTIPARFWDDYESSNEDAGEVMKRTKSKVTVQFTEQQLKLFIQAADLYATGSDDFWEEYRGLVLSARATMKALGLG